MPSKKIKYFLLIFEDVDSGVICMFIFFFLNLIKQLYVLQILLQPFRPQHSIVHGVLTRVG